MELITVIRANGRLHAARSIEAVFRAIDTTTREEDFVSEIRLADGEWLDFDQFVTRFCR